MHLFGCKGLSDDGIEVARGTDRILGDTAGSWFQNRRFRPRGIKGATVESL